MPPTATTQPPSLDDYALMRAISNGDSVAFKAFYDRHSPTVYALCIRMLKNLGDAEQLLTDVFFEIWSSRDRYDETRSNPLTYLMRITRSRAIDKLRRKGPVGSAGGISLDPATGIDVPIDDAPDIAAQASENRAIIANALNVLDRDQRQVIECAYFDGLSHSQIADKLQKPLGTIKSSMRAGMVRLRELLSRSQGNQRELS